MHSVPRPIRTSVDDRVSVWMSVRSDQQSDLEREPHRRIRAGHTHVVTIHIRSLTADDVDPLAAALAEAFRRDDLAVWIFPDPLDRDAALAAMFRSRLDDALHDDETVVDVADDLSGAAIWQSPRVRLDDDPPPGARPDVVDAFRTIFAARPQPPYWYLHGIGARTERRGIGSGPVPRRRGRRSGELPIRLTPLNSAHPGRISAPRGRLSNAAVGAALLRKPAAGRRCRPPTARLPVVVTVCAVNVWRPPLYISGCD